MIDINQLKNKSGLSILEKYSGKNPYIKNMKKQYLKNKKTKFTDNQLKYIINYHNVEPMLINKVINITNFLGNELQKMYDLTFTPERILVEFMLADSEKTFHVYGKLKRNQKESKMYFLPKSQVIDDPYFTYKEVNVDFEKYTLIDKLKRIPFQHQKEGINFLLSRNGCILADSMGLGKTYQAIIGAIESGAENILIVCPSSVKINWEREINNFDDRTSVISGRKWKRDKFTIINYDILKNFHTIGDGKKSKDTIVEFNRELVNSKFDLVIIDEAHFLKNPKSIRGEIMIDLCVKYNVEKVWLLTGTPIANRPMDFYNLLKLIKAPIVDNWQFYAKRYCDAKTFTKTLKNDKKKKIWITNGASNLDELHLKTKNLILRRLKEDVLDMPDKTVSPLYQKLNDEGIRTYNSLWDDFIKSKENNLLEKSRNIIELILLRKFIAMEAINYTIEEAENAIEQGEKVVIFTTFTDELNELKNHFGNICVTHNGKMNEKDKQFSVDEFQNNPKIKVFIGNIMSAGVGITLTAGSYVIFNSFDWVTGNNEQAEDRCFRIGQKNNVTIKYQLFLDTISYQMWMVLKNKKDVINTLLNEDKNNYNLINEIINLNYED